MLLPAISDKMHCLTKTFSAFMESKLFSVLWVHIWNVETVLLSQGPITQHCWYPMSDRLGECQLQTIIPELGPAGLLGLNFETNLDFYSNLVRTKKLSYLSFAQLYKFNGTLKKENRMDFLAHLVYQPKSLIQSCFVRRASLLCVHTPPAQG